MADAETRGERRVSRLGMLQAAVLLVFGLLAARLWHIQVVRADELGARADANRNVAREIEPDRGVVYDASGQQLVFNVPRFTVSLVPGALGELPPDRREAVLRQVADALGRPLRTRSASLRVGRVGPRDAAEIDEDAALSAMFGARRSIESALQDEEGALRFTGWNAVPVDRNVPREAAFELMEALDQLPGVLISEPSVREYPAGPSMAHILGFTGSIPEAQIGGYLDEGYRIYDIVGRSGLEATYEPVLRGRKGEKIVRVDVEGRELDAGHVEREPVAGRNLHLTIDLAFQEAAEAALAKGLAGVGAKAGAVAAIDPRNGAVRALVTLPNYDNNLFSTGASPDEFVALLTDPNRPLVNRAVSGQPPGSTFKMITASAALQEGIVTRATRILDPGVITLPNEYNPEIVYPFVCWQRSGHGSVAVVQAIAQSCDVYFYEVSGGYYENGASQDGLGSERLARYAESFGLGRRTEVELLGESGGHVPTPAWLMDYNGEYWGTGQTYYMGIGQGYTLATPLQMANVTAAVANGGTLHRPHLVSSVAPGADRDEAFDEELDDAAAALAQPGGVLGRVPVAPEHLAAVREGMRLAVTGGTANPSWTRLPTEVDVAGKTGTAEFCDWAPEEGGCRTDREGHWLTHAWFVAFAPYENPEIAVAVFIDGSGLDDVIQGSEVAAPVAADILRHYFDLPLPAEPAEDCEGEDCPEEDSGARDAEAQDAGEGSADATEDDAAGAAADGDAAETSP